MSPIRRSLATLLLLLALAHPALATWSIVVVNTRTGEACVATATCIASDNIKRAVPVIVPGLGAGAAQSAGDFSGVNRKKIWDDLKLGLSPQDILTDLAASPGHQQKQYGVVDMHNDPITFSGNAVGSAKHGVTGVVGDLRYAIQGNVLVGSEVVTAAEIALLATPGDLGQKVMAAMEAARSMGGDGRCSCSPLDPTSCGVPPPAPFKSAHVGCVVLARVGDLEGVCTSGQGCANGSYYLDIQFVGASTDIDPVLALQQKYDAWRFLKSGKADHILSTVRAGAQSLVADGQDSTDVTVRLVDLDGVPIAHGGHIVKLELLAGSSGATQASAVTDHGDGSYTFALSAGTASGTDTWRIRVAGDGGRATLHPDLTIRVDPLSELHSGFDSVSALEGASVPLVVNAGAGSSLRSYLVLGSAAGTQPGIPFAGTTLPLNRDKFLRFTLTRANGASLPATAGLLDGNGRAQAAFVALPQSLAPYVGRRIDWSTLVFEPHGTRATSTAGFDVVY